MLSFGRVMTTVPSAPTVPFAVPTVVVPRLMVIATSPVGTIPVDDSTCSVALAATAGFTGFGETEPVSVDFVCDTVRRPVPAEVLKTWSAP